MELIALLSGALLVAGPILAVAGSRRVPEPPPRPANRLRIGLRIPPLPAAGAVLTAAVTLWLTGWPVAVLAAGAAVVLLPRMPSGREAARRITPLEAVEAWIRQLSDVLASSAGIEEALAVSARNAPAPIRDEVAALARRLALRVPVEPALRAFADDIDDPVGDMAERARHRTTARWVVGALLGYTVFALLNTAYVAPFGSPAGQAVLAVVLALYGGAFAWLHRLGRPPTGHRFLNPEGSRP